MRAILFPMDHPQYGRVLRSYQQHMATLARFQNEEGMWREVVDHPGSYSEFSSTFASAAMIATSMLRGIRREWLDRAAYEPIVNNALVAILARIGPDGQLIDVCESTNKQPALKD